MKDLPKALSWMKESHEAFKNEISLSKSCGTVEAYGYDVGRFLEYLATLGVKKATAITTDHIIGYLSACKKQKKSDATINRYYMSIRAYFRYLRRSKIILIEVTQDVPVPKNKQKAPRVPTIEEMQLLLQQPNLNTESGVRDRAILELLYSSGLRASELCNLEIEDFGVTNIRVKCGKRGNTRTLPITPSASQWIQNYIEKHRGSKSGYLFVTLTGRQLQRQRLSKNVTNYALKAGLEEVTTHTLRHACATHLLDEGADLRMIQDILGHSSIVSTQRYTHLSSQKMEEMFDKFHPRREKNDHE